MPSQTFSGYTFGQGQEEVDERSSVDS